ncbi:uncharacterized protein LOC128241620 [Mya arenaria]|uniref:uncharacterized protein LOC128241620 n=1 Tax=Mya arenaria TaxID=6604 RepID=UPI0022E04B32|nr:uncharacterized protein LOC128241620 [Mya arenaria]
MDNVKKRVDMFEKLSREQNIPNEVVKLKTKTTNRPGKAVQRRISMFENMSDKQNIPTNGLKSQPKFQNEVEKTNKFIEECFADKTKCPFDGRLRRLNKTEIDHIIAFCDGVQIQKGRFADDLCGSVHFNSKSLPGLNIPVALKDIQTKNVDAKNSMKNEEMAAILRHFAVVPTFAKYKSPDENRICFLSAFMINGDLEEVLKDDNVRAIRRESIILSRKLRTKIMLQIAQGIAFLHSSTENKKGLLHLDIKSANIFLDSKFNARIGDFGNAREVKSLKNKQKPECDSYYGTHGYLPEKISTISKELDYFAFGVTMLELLTGENPCSVDFGQYCQIRLEQCRKIEQIVEQLQDTLQKGDRRQSLCSTKCKTRINNVTVHKIVKSAIATLNCSCDDDDNTCIEKQCRNMMSETHEEIMTNNMCESCLEFKQGIKTSISDLEKLKEKLLCRSSHPEWLRDLKDNEELCKCFHGKMHRFFKWKINKNEIDIALNCLKVVSSQSNFSFQNDVVSKHLNIVRKKDLCRWNKPPGDNCEICLINPRMSYSIDSEMFVHTKSCVSHIIVCSECANSHYLNPVECHSCDDGHPLTSGQNTAVICIAGGGEGADIFLNDAIKVKQTFQDMFNSPDKYHFLIKPNEETYRKRLKREIEGINENEDISTLIFFYSGHGSPEKLEPSNKEVITKDKFETYLKRLHYVSKVFSYFDCCFPFTINGSMQKSDSEKSSVKSSEKNFKKSSEKSSKKSSVKSFQYKAATNSTACSVLEEMKQSVFTTLFLQALKLNTEKINCFHVKDCKVCIRYKEKFMDKLCYVDSDDIFSYIEDHRVQGVDFTPSKATTGGEVIKEDRLFVPANKLVKLQVRLILPKQNIERDELNSDEYRYVNPRLEFNDIRIGLFKDMFGKDIGEDLHEYADVLSIKVAATGNECLSSKDLFEIWTSKRLVDVSLRKNDDIEEGRIGIFIEVDEQKKHQDGIELVLQHLFNSSYSPFHDLSSYLKQRDDFEQTSITLTVPYNYCKFVCFELKNWKR